MTDDEIPLAGGNASGAVVRVGDTVRKPWHPAAAEVAAFVASLRAAGVDAPAVLGRDERGRQVVEFVPGRVAMAGPELDDETLARVGRLVRRIHDASAAASPAASRMVPLIPAPGVADLVCHNDLAPWNLVVGEAGRLVFIDWDASAPSTRGWDLAYAAQAFALGDGSHGAVVAARRLAAFVDGYGADAGLRAALPALLARRAGAMLSLLRQSARSGAQPWGRMFAEGHGAHWLGATAFALRHRDRFLAALAAGPAARTARPSADERGPLAAPRGPA